MLCEILILYDISETNTQFAMFLNQGLINILHLLLTCMCTALTGIQRISHVLKIVLHQFGSSSFQYRLMTVCSI